MRTVFTSCFLFIAGSILAQFTGQIEFDLEGVSPSTGESESSHWSMHVGPNNLTMELHNADEGGGSLIFVPNTGNGDLNLYSTANGTEVFFTSKGGQRSATSSLMDRGFRMTKTGETDDVIGITCDVWAVVNENLEGEFCIAPSINIDFAPYIDMFVDNVFMRSMEGNDVKGFPMYWEVLDRYDGSIYRKGGVTMISDEAKQDFLVLPSHLKSIETMME
tara:strand:+ start:210 stop:866 length:657 start_codon:yes stop_codon:yes gene_type:complete